MAHKDSAWVLLNKKVEQLEWELEQARRRGDNYRDAMYVAQKLAGERIGMLIEIKKTFRLIESIDLPLTGG